MTIDAWLQANTSQLKQAGIETSRLDCLVLLSDEIEKDKSWILAHPEYELQIEKTELLNTKIAQRARHTPLAYIRGKSEFYGRDFVVNTDVLVPRPESEDVIELLKQIADYEQSPIIYDVGTGSGALAITAKLELPNSIVFALDIDPACLRVAQKNAEHFHSHVTFLLGDLLEPFRELKTNSQKLIVLANLPYVPLGYHINLAATHEPEIALYSGKDGLDHYRRLFTELFSLPILPEYIITESLPAQHLALTEIADEGTFLLQATSGFAQCFIRHI